MADERRMTRIGNPGGGGLARPDNGEVAEAKTRAVEAFRLTGTRAAASRASGVSRRTIGKWLLEDENFRAEMEDAREDAIEKLEEEAQQRAMGRERALHHQGRVTGDTVKEYSDLLMIFLLKSLRPNVYRDNSKIEVESVQSPDQAAARDRLTAALEAIAQRRALVNANAVEGEIVKVPTE